MKKLLVTTLQMLSFEGIQRFLAIQFLTQRQIIVYVYQQALEKKPLFDILKHLNIPS